MYKHLNSHSVQKKQSKHDNNKKIRFQKALFNMQVTINSANDNW